jgi:hypothetical protein
MGVFMSQYTITYKSLNEMDAKFSSATQVLERNCDNLLSMSCDVMEGFENEARMLANWAHIAENRSNDIRKASDCLKNTVDVLNSSEKTAHGLVSDFCSPLKSVRRTGTYHDTGGSGSTGGSGGLLRKWDNGEAGSRDWSLIKPIPWPMILPPVMFILPGLIRPDPRRRVLDFIRDRIARRDEHNNSKDNDQTGDDIEDGLDCVSPDVETGCGEICVEDGEFAEEEACVNADMGAAACIIGGGAAAGGAAIGGSMGGSGGKGVKTGSENMEDINEIDENTDKKDKEEYRIKDEEKTASEEEQNINEERNISDGEAPTGASAGAGGSEGLSEIGTASGGLGVAAPVVGVAAAGSMVASGAVIGQNIKDKKDAAQQAGKEKPEAPVISAHESGGIFTGNLNSNYVLLATAFSLAFVGASVAAAASMKKKKPDERLKIGYGVSAVLSSGEIQVR